MGTSSGAYRHEEAPDAVIAIAPRSKYPKITYDTYVKAILWPTSKEVLEFEQRVPKIECHHCSRKGIACLPEATEHLRCKPCRDSKSQCSWKMDFILQYTTRDLGLSSEEARKRFLEIDHRSIRANSTALTELDEAREHRGGETRSRKRKHQATAHVTSPSSPNPFDFVPPSTKRLKHNEDMSDIKHRQEFLRVPSTSSRIVYRMRRREKISGMSFVPLSDDPDSEPVHATSLLTANNTASSNTFPAATSNSPAQIPDDSTHNVTQHCECAPNELALPPMFVPLRRRSHGERRPSATYGRVPAPVPTLAQTLMLGPSAPAPANATETPKVDSAISEEQHKEAMEIVLKQALEDQIAAKSALARAAEEIKCQAEEVKMVKQAKEEIWKQLVQKTHERDQWRTRPSHLKSRLKSSRMRAQNC